ncbi:hypothetical protein BS78_09G200400 [Paspalum vaginatum]|nr:hypothetical protein BS78_09G200400 [Paspalum vaginatum]
MPGSAPLLTCLFRGLQCGAAPWARGCCVGLNSDVCTIGFRFTGTPFFHSMVARAQAAAESDICVLVDAEIILLPEIVSVLAYFSKVDRDWFFVAMARNITDFHYKLADNGSHWVQADGKEVSFKKQILLMISQDSYSSR